MRFAVIHAEPAIEIDDATDEFRREDLRIQPLIEQMMPIGFAGFLEHRVISGCEIRHGSLPHG